MTRAASIWAERACCSSSPCPNRDAAESSRTCQKPSPASHRHRHRFLDRLIRGRAGIEFGGHDITWVSCFNLSHGLADRYRWGRVFLAGDAAHVHSPVGGQGLNTGIQEVHNLLWKIAAADRLGKEAAEQPLDSYETERRPIAQRMVKGTARATAVMASNRRITQILRACLGPRVLGHPSIQARLGRQVGMLETAYHSERATGASAGRRMADPELRSGGRLHPRLSDRSHTWVAWVRPDEPAPDPDDATWRGLPVLLLTDGVLAPAQPWPDESERVALVRPDRYVAATGRTPEAIWSALQRYAHGSLPVPGVTRAGSTAGSAAEPSKIPQHRRDRAAPGRRGCRRAASSPHDSRSPS